MMRITNLKNRASLRKKLVNRKNPGNDPDFVHVKNVNNLGNVKTVISESRILINPHSDPLFQLFSYPSTQLKCHSVIFELREISKTLRTLCNTQQVLYDDATKRRTAKHKW